MSTPGPGPDPDDPEPGPAAPETDPLVEGRQDSTTPWSGIGLAESAQDLHDAIAAHSWVDELLAGLSLTSDVAAMVLDPIGTLVNSGLGWLVEHVRPLSDALDDLTGDPDAIDAQARTWQNIADALARAADDLRRVATPTRGWDGPAGDAARRALSDRAVQLGAAGTVAAAMALAVGDAGRLVATVRETVRDFITQLVATLIERVPQWGAEEAVSLGVLTPHVVAAALAVIARVTLRVTKLVVALVRSLESLAALTERADTVLAGLDQAFTARPTPTTTPTTPEAADPPRTKPDPTPTTHPQHHGPDPTPDLPPSPGRISDALDPPETKAASAPITIEPQVLETLREDRVVRDARGLIVQVDGRPVDDYVNDLARRRARLIRDAVARRTVLRSQVGPVSAIVIDRRSGELIEAHNSTKTSEVDVDDLHPLLRGRLQSMLERGPYADTDSDGSVRTRPDGGPGTRVSPHPDLPLRHAEVKAVNDLLLDRGPGAGQISLEEMSAAPYFPFGGSDVRPAPFCANCSALLDGVHSTTGRFRTFPPTPDGFEPPR